MDRPASPAGPAPAAQRPLPEALGQAPLPDGHAAEPEPQVAPRQHLAWDAEGLWRTLAPLLPGLSVEVLARCESTNTRLVERARLSAGRRDAPVTRPGELDPAPLPGSTPLGRRSDDTLPCLLVAEQQTRGRGRLGRGWASAPGASLTFSLALPLAPADWSGLSLAVGVAIADALEPLPAAPAGSSRPPPRIGLKWPNDLWLRDAACVGRKLGGILIETVPVGRHRMCVVGVGLNIAPLPAQAAPEQLSSGIASLQELQPAARPPQVLHAVARPLAEALLRFEREGFAGFATRFAERDLLRGLWVDTSQPGAPGGIADGVDARGALRLQAEGAPQVLSGEVSVRLPGRAGSEAAADTGGPAC